MNKLMSTGIIASIFLIMLFCGFANAQSPSTYFPQNVGNHWRYITRHDTTQSNPDRWTFCDITNDTTFGISGENISHRNRWSENIFSHQDTGAYMIEYLNFTNAGDLTRSAMEIPDYDTIYICDPLWYRLENPMVPGDSTIYIIESYRVITKVLSTNETIIIGLGQFNNCLKIIERDFTNGVLSEEVIGFYIPISYYPVAGLGFQIVNHYHTPDSVRVATLELDSCYIHTVGIVEENGIPAISEISQSYPNPFNAQTIISFSLPKATLITIDIFDILGRNIETLAKGMMPAGEHQVVWDASGKSSGIYFYRIMFDEFSLTKKMILAK